MRLAITGYWVCVLTGGICVVTGSMPSAGGALAMNQGCLHLSFPHRVTARHITGIGGSLLHCVSLFTTLTTPGGIQQYAGCCQGAQVLCVGVILSVKQVAEVILSLSCGSCIALSAAQTTALPYRSHRLAACALPLVLVKGCSA